MNEYLLLWTHTSEGLSEKIMSRQAREDSLVNEAQTLAVDPTDRNRKEVGRP